MCITHFPSISSLKQTCFFTSTTLDMKLNDLEKITRYFGVSTSNYAIKTMCVSFLNVFIIFFLQYGVS